MVDNKKRALVLCGSQCRPYLYKIIIFMKILVAAILSLIFLLLSALHIYWGFGGKSVTAATMPTKENNDPVIAPGPIACFVVGIALLSFAVLVLTKAGIILFTLPARLFNYALWVIAVIFLLRAMGEFKYVGFFKQVKTTRFGQMDTRYYSPLCLAVGVLCVILEMMN